LQHAFSDTEKRDQTAVKLPNSGFCVYSIGQASGLSIARLRKKKEGRLRAPPKLLLIDQAIIQIHPGK
jgi:hypothetical protein